MSKYEGARKMSVANVREFWNRKVDKAIQMFEYGAWTEEKFLDEMSRLGYNKAVIREKIYEG